MTEQKDIITYLKECPNCLEVAVGETTYYLVHAWPGDTSFERLWKCPPKGIQSKNPLKSKKLIVEHTVTIQLLSEDSEKQMNCVMRMVKDQKHLRVVRTSEFTAIDCGCGHRSIPARRLACIRLDDG